MNSNCWICDVEAKCSYEYKPCDCCNYRKFKPKEKREPDTTAPLSTEYKDEDEDIEALKFRQFGWGLVPDFDQIAGGINEQNT